MATPRLSALALAALALLSTPRNAAQAQMSMIGGGTDMLGVAGAEFARMAGGNSDIVAFGVVSSVGLTDVTASEMLGGSGPAIDAGFVAVSGWNPSLGSGLIGSTPTTSVQRSLNVVWAAWVHRRSAGNLVVDYDVFGSDGSPGVVVHQSDSGSRIIVTATATAPFQAGRSGKYRLMAGGGAFGCDLSGVETSGRHEGQLVVTLSVL